MLLYILAPRRRTVNPSYARPSRNSQPRCLTNSMPGGNLVVPRAIRPLSSGDKAKNCTSPLFPFFGDSQCRKLPRF
jgi:hypothetical protein